MCLHILLCSDPNKPVPVRKTWPEFDVHSEHYLDINTRLSVKSRMDAARTAFWTELAPKMLQNVHDFHRPDSATAHNTNVPVFNHILG